MKIFTGGLFRPMQIRRNSHEPIQTSRPTIQPALRAHYGDGGYTIQAGYDAEGKVVALEVIYISDREEDEE